MQTILEGTTGASSFADLSAMGAKDAVERTVQGSSGNGGRMRSIQRAPSRSEISPYCGPELVWKRQYFIVDSHSLRQSFFHLGGMLALVAILIDGADKIGVAVARRGGFILERRGNDQGFAGDALSGASSCDVAAVENIAGEVGVGIRRPGNVEGMGLLIGHNGETRRNRGRKNVFCIDGDGL